MNELAMALIKPDAFVRNLDATILHILQENGLSIVARKMVQLNEDMIRAYQPILNEPSEFGEGWKMEAIDALSVRPVLVLLVSGENAIERATFLKKKIRSIYCIDSGYQDRVIFNLLHTADNISELENNVRILIPESQHLLHTEELV